MEIGQLTHKIAYEMFFDNKSEIPTARKALLEMFQLAEIKEEEVENIYNGET